MTSMAILRHSCIARHLVFACTSVACFDPESLKKERDTAHEMSDYKTWSAQVSPQEKPRAGFVSKC
jgi:hypothetical protein